MEQFSNLNLEKKEKKNACVLFCIIFDKSGIYGMSSHLRKKKKHLNFI